MFLLWTLFVIVASIVVILALIADSQAKKKKQEEWDRITGPDEPENTPGSPPPAPRSHIRIPVRPPVENPTVNRLVTFVAALVASAIVYGIVWQLLALWLGIQFNLGMQLGLGLPVVVFTFYLGIVEVGGKDKNGKFETAGWRGVIKVFGAPIWIRSLQWVLPPGKSWVIPFLMSVQSEPTKEQAYDIPREPDSDGFHADSISQVKPGDPSSGTKYVQMFVKARIRFRITNLYKWVAQDAQTVEKTLVSRLVQTMRYTATNGKYPDRNDIIVNSDFELMQMRTKLSEALTEDIKAMASADWGIGIIDVIVREIRPADKKLVDRYQQVAQEIADRDAQTIEGKNILALAKMYESQHGLKPGDALMYAMVTAGKTTLANFQGLKNAVPFINGLGKSGQGTSPSPNPPTT